MSEVPFVPPEFEEKAFNCPHCGAYARQGWSETLANFGAGWRGFGAFKVSLCSHCHVASHWHAGKLVYPSVRSAPPANLDLGDDIKKIYEEAAAIQSASPRGSAALLRLAVQLLCVQLGESGKNINEDIRALVKKGLPLEIQQALDVVRVIGNNAVHPGEITIDDQPEVVAALYALINSISDRLITQPRKSAEMFAALPEGIRNAIHKRDTE